LFNQNIAQVFCFETARFKFLNESRTAVCGLLSSLRTHTFAVESTLTQAQVKVLSLHFRKTITTLEIVQQYAGVIFLVRRSVLEFIWPTTNTVKH